jgi:hypothetical protein
LVGWQIGVPSSRPQRRFREAERGDETAASEKAMPA